jgi:hypothetical protein
MYILSLIPALILLGQVRNLKYMVPFSMLANIFMICGFSITLYYIFSNVRSLDSVKLFSSAEQLPRFFATVIFAIEGIGVVSFPHVHTLDVAASLLRFRQLDQRDLSSIIDCDRCR